MRTTRKKKARGSTILLRRRIIITVLLVVIAGFGTLAAVVLTKRAKADVGYDPYFTLSTGPSKIRVFQPLSSSVGNEANFTASGTASPGTTINLQVDGVTKGAAETDSKGAWTKDLTGVADGDHQLTASTSLSGPFSVVAATGFMPGYSIVDLTTNGLVSAATVGIGTAFGQINYGGGSVAVNESVRVNNSTVYVVRQRSVTVLDVASQRATKTIFLSDLFNSGGENPQDTGEMLKQAVVSADGTSVYLLYSGDTSAKILKINVATNTLVSSGGFPASVVAGATAMVLAPDGSKLYTVAYNNTELDTIQTADGSVSTNTLGASARDIALSPNGSSVYISSAMQDTKYYIASIDIATSNFDDHTIDLGENSFEPDTIHVSSQGDKLYLASTYVNSIKVYDTASKELVGTINTASPVVPQTKQIVESQGGSRIYFPLTDDSVAVVDHSASSLTAVINKPASNYSHLHGLLFYNNKLYTTYDRIPDPVADLLNASGNPTKLFSSLAVSDATTNTDVTATPITVNSYAAGLMSDPVVTQPIVLTNTIDFSVGKPITITSPAADATLDTSTPTIVGRGPKNKTIKLSINNAPGVNVSVDGSGNWSKQVTLTKNKNNSIVAVYNNKRTQLVLPNTFVFGSDIAKNQLSVIDGKSGLETNPISLPPFGVSSVKINTAAAVNPSSSRYYVINTDLSSLVSNAISAAISGDTAQLETLLEQLPDSQFGGVDVYSRQTTLPLKRIKTPNGTIPISMKVSPDGKKGMILSFDIKKLSELLSTQSAPTNTMPIQLQRVDLQEESLVGAPITLTFDVPGASGNDQLPSQIGSLVSGGLVGLSNVGSYTADGSKFYASNFHLGKLSIINTSTGSVSEFSVPNTSAFTAFMATYINPTNNVLYITYLDVTIASDGSGATVVPGIMLINTADNSLINKSVLPELPLFNFAVNSSGSRIYMATINLESLINSIGSLTNNPQAVLVDSLPSFNLTIYNTENGQVTNRPITNNEIPMNLVLSPDNKQVFIPTLGQNVVHVYDVDSDTMDAGNAPILLGGISTALATSSNIGEMTIGTFNDSKSYFVPPDAPVVKCAYNSKILADSPDCKPDDGKNTTTTLFKFLPTNSTPAASAQSLDIPKQTVQVIRDTAQQALNSNVSAVKTSTMRTWLVYLVYGTFLAVLGATGYVIWRTDMLLGVSEEETYM